MSQLQWVTPLGNLANAAIGIPFEVKLIAVNTDNYGANITYQLISGSLPSGVTLTSSGVISGTPTYSSPSNNYFTSASASFIVRATSNDGSTPVDGSFSILTSNTVNSDFSWLTPGGNLGTLPSGDFYQLQFEVNESIVNEAATYSLVSGTLPPGMQVVSGFSYSITGIALGQQIDIKSWQQASSSPTQTFSSSELYSEVVYYQGVVITVSESNNAISDGKTVQLKNIVGSTELNGNTYYAQRISSTKFALFTDGALTQPLDGTTISPYVSGGIAWDVGYLQGVPTLLNPVAVDQSESFRFTIRATNTLGHVRDQAFTVTVTDVYAPVIEPLVTNLGAVFDGEFYNLQLEVIELNSNVTIQWSNIGSLPPGLTIDSTGLLSGYIRPAPLVGAFGPAGFDAETTTGVTVVSSNSIIPGSTYTIQSIGTTDFTLIGATSNTVGLSFTANNTSTGSGTALYISPTSSDPFGVEPFDFNESSQTITYNFTIRAFDGANYALKNYTLEVVSKGDFKADSDTITVDSEYLTVDADDIYLPVILNANVAVLPVGRGGSNYAFQFQGFDFQDEPLTFSLTNVVGTFDTYVLEQDAGFDFGGTGVSGANESVVSGVTGTGRSGVGFDSFDPNVLSTTYLPGLSLDPISGWLHGTILPQGISYTTYEFGVQVSKTVNGTTFTSAPVYFTLPVLGNLNNTIAWKTSADLGSINNGEVSQISVQASASNSSESLVYTLVDKPGVPIRLPQGLKLLPSGNISGRVSFEATSIDVYDTTFDGNNLTFDKDYVFTVQATTQDGLISSTQEFTLTVNIVDSIPYDNLYLRALPSISQRQTWQNVLSNEGIFVPDLIYRSDDPWFGVQQNIEMLFLPGLTPATLNQYVDAMTYNHYTKRYNFGSIGTAVVLDNNYNTIYEVVYINVVDPELNSSNQGPALELNLSNVIANPYIDADGNDFKIVYPNTSQDMTSRIVSGIGYADQNSLPDWMTSNQPDSTSPNKFTTPIGFTRAVVLAYVNPGYSKLIAYRLQNAGINFNNIEFAVDRYFIDDFYSSNFNISTGVYTTGRESTFDTLPNQNVGTLVNKGVTYAVTTSFNQINGRPLDYINANGGIDGVTTFNAGETLIFAKQENFVNAGPADGWVDYTDAYIGQNILQEVISGYDSESYDTYKVIPGFLEKQNLSLPSVTLNASAITATNNGGTGIVTVNDTSSLVLGSTVAFSGLSFGGINTSTTYTVSSIVNSTQFTINTPASSASMTSQTFTGTGSQLAFALNTTPAVSNITVYVDGVQLTQTTNSPGDFVLSGYNVVFNVAPAQGSAVSVSYLANDPGTTGSFFNGVGGLTASMYVNERGGVWQINIVDNIVSLTFVQEILPNNRVRIIAGKTYGGSVVYYNSNYAANQGVPNYLIYNPQQTSYKNKTTFNGGSTRFFSYRDQYYTPGTQDKYIKFPQFGAFE